MFETQKVRRHDKFRKEWSQHQNKCKSQMGQDQVSGGVSVLCWLAAPVAIIRSMKITWIKRLLSFNSIWTLIFEEGVKVKNELLFTLGTEFPKDIAKTQGIRFGKMHLILSAN